MVFQARGLARTLALSVAILAAPSGATVEQNESSSTEATAQGDPARRTELEAELAQLRAEAETQGAAAASWRRKATAAETRVRNLSRRVQALEGGAPGSTATVAAGAQPCLAVRVTPKDGVPVDCLQPGSSVSLLEVKDGWAKIRAGRGTEGWVAQRLLEGVSAPPATADSDTELERLQTELERERARAESASSDVKTLRARLVELEQRLAEPSMGAEVDPDDIIQPAVRAADPSLEEGEEVQRAVRSVAVAVPTDDSPELAPNVETVVVARVATCLKLRAAPVDGEPLDCLGRGTHLALLERQDGWARTRRADGVEGWAALQFLDSVAAPMASAPADTLKARLDAQSELLTGLETQLAETVAARDRQLNELGQLQEQLESATASRDQQTSAIEELRSQLEAAQAQSTSLTEKLEEQEWMAGQQEAQLAELQGQLRSEATTGTERLGAIERLQAQLEASQSKSADLAEKLEASEQQRESSAAEQKAELAQLQEQLRTASSSETDQQGAIADLGAQLEAAKGQSAALSERLSESEAERERLEKRAEQVTALEEQLAEATSSGSKQRQAVTELRARLETTEAERSEKVEHLEAQLTEAASASEKQQQLVVELRAQLQAAEADRAEQVGRLETQLATAAGTGDEQQQLAAELREQLEATEAEKEKELATLAAQLATLQEQLVQTREARAEQGDLVARLRAELAATTAENENLTREPTRTGPEAQRVVEPHSEPTEAPVVEPTPASDVDATSMVEEAEVDLPAAENSAGEPDPIDLAARVRQWAEAWSSQTVDDYLSYYATSFRPASGASRSDWAAQRQQRLTSPEFIEVELEDLEARIDGSDRARVRFLQSYRSNTFNDQVRKVLTLILEDGQWKIWREVSSPTD